MPLSAETQRAALPPISERDVRVLEFERRSWSTRGAKDEAIRVELGLTTARYYQVLNAVLESPAAYAHDPILVRRLRRIRSQRRPA